MTLQQLLGIELPVGRSAITEVARGYFDRAAYSGPR